MDGTVEETETGLTHLTVPTTDGDNVDVFKYF